MMRGGKVFWIVLVSVLPLLSAPARADTAAAWEALRRGGAVALMRHADAPGGAGDPPGLKLEDCSTQRNLSEKGRAQAAAAGAQLRGRGIAIARVLSSPWCRCLETARLMEVGPVEIEAAFSNAFVLATRREELKASALALLTGWRGGTLLVVTHGANVQALSGHSLASAEMLVVEPEGGALRVIGRIPAP